MRMSKMFTAFAASYFVLVFLKDGTLLKLTKTASTGAQQVVRGSKRLTQIT